MGLAARRLDPTDCQQKLRPLVILRFAYDDVGRVHLITSYADTGGTTVVNQVVDAYDGWGNLVSKNGRTKPARW